MHTLTPQSQPDSPSLRSACAQFAGWPDGGRVPVSSILVGSGGGDSQAQDPLWGVRMMWTNVDSTSTAPALSSLYDPEAPSHELHKA